MFDLGFSELFLIAIVALIVLGPERLPKAARFAGLWIRRARAQWQSVKQDFENEITDEQLRNAMKQTREDLRQAREELHREFGDIDAVARHDLIDTGAAAHGLGNDPADVTASPHVAENARAVQSSSDDATPAPDAQSAEGLPGDDIRPADPHAIPRRMTDESGSDEPR